jgi:hypothetical protein
MCKGGVEYTAWSVHRWVFSVRDVRKAIFMLPVILTPSNLPPWMCMKNPVLFLIVIIPGPKNPKRRVDVYLQPLIDELSKLWSDGVFS